MQQEGDCQPTTEQLAFPIALHPLVQITNKPDDSEQVLALLPNRIAPYRAVSDFGECCPFHHDAPGVAGTAHQVTVDPRSSTSTFQNNT